jgi:hypothetical protein
MRCQNIDIAERRPLQIERLERDAAPLERGKQWLLPLRVLKEHHEIGVSTHVAALSSSQVRATSSNNCSEVPKLPGYGRRLGPGGEPNSLTKSVFLPAKCYQDARVKEFLPETGKLWQS